MLLTLPQDAGLFGICADDGCLRNIGMLDGARILGEPVIGANVHLLPGDATLFSRHAPHLTRALFTYL